ncbi:hypothetical protein JCM10213_001987 [Rhodosporidiobolus nylandii]
MTTYTLLAAGSNSHGQLGTSSLDDAHSFVPIPLPPHLQPVDLACGANHTLLLIRDERTGRAELLAAGSNARRQLFPAAGEGKEELRTTFAPIEMQALLPDEIKHRAEELEPACVAACWETSFLLLRPRRGGAEEGGAADVLLSLGASDWGERGVDALGTRGPGAASVVSFSHLLHPGEVLRVERLVAGPRHVLALLSFSSSDPTGEPGRKLLVGWGASRHGQLGPSAFSSAPEKTRARPEVVTLPAGYAAEGVKDVAVGKEHSAVLLEKPGGERKLLLLGTGRHGQLGPVGEEPYPLPPALTVGVEGPARDRKGKQPARSSNLLSAVSLLSHLPSSSASPLNGPDFSGVGCTWNGTYALLSLPGPSSASSPVAGVSLPNPVSLPRPPPAGRPAGAANLLVSFGSNAHGQLGSGASISSFPSASPPSPAGTGEAHLIPLPSVARSSSSPNPAPAASVPAAGRIAHLACGSEHVLALLSPPSPPPNSPSSSPDPSECAAEEAGGEAEVYGWGWNEHGNLGLSHSMSTTSSSPSSPPPPAPEGLEDVHLPRRIWPQPRSDAEDAPQGKDSRRVTRVWGGMATSWILLKDGDGAVETEDE